MTARLELSGVTRAFAGGAGIHDIDLEVGEGEIHALVGLNGAGKSTLMRVALGMLRPNRGTVRIDGHELRDAGPGTWARVGHLVEFPLAYAELTGRQNLELGALLRGAARRTRSDVASAAIAEFGLQQYAGIRVRAMSLGNRQRIGLASALQHHPDLAVLDEPTNALDPAGTILLREALLRRAAVGAGILVSSHHLDEVARVADRISLVNRGRVIGTLDPRGREARARVLRGDPRRRSSAGCRVSPLRAAVVAEAVKVTRGRAVAATSTLLVLGVVALSGSFALAARAGNTAILDRLGDVADGTPWEVFLGGATQITGAAGVLGAGVVLSWIFGREFADGTVTGLFGLPVSRGRIAFAKALVYFAWAATISVLLAGVLLAVGPLLGLGPIGGADVAAAGRIAVLAGCSALVASPAALFATLGRGYLPGIAATVVVVASAQIAVLAGAGMWFPVATAALWAMAPTVVPVGALALVATLPVVFLGATVVAWSRLQLDR